MSDSISLISDIHVKNPGDQAFERLTSFLRHPVVKSSRSIYLLGDIFDVMIGRHSEYIEMYEEYFGALGDLLREGKEIYYFQGNHDIHVELNYRTYFKKNSIPDENFIYQTRPLVKTLWGKKFFFAHGDEIEIGNWSYKIYKGVVNSGPIKFLVENILSYNTIHSIAERASRDSRKRSGRYGTDLVREKFRQAAVRVGEKGYDYIICGHSHIKDDYVHGDGASRGFIYLNNGYVLNSNTFIHLGEGRHSFVDLSPSGV